MTKISKKKSKSIEKTGVVLADFHNPIKKKRGPGRPAKTLADLPKNWKRHIIEEMSQGASIKEIRADFGLHQKVHERFMREYPEYNEQVEWGKQLSEAWWMRTGRIQLFNKDFSFTGWYMNMKNRFNWTDKQEQSVKLNIPVRITISQEEKTIELKPPIAELDEGNGY